MMKLKPGDLVLENALTDRFCEVETDPFCISEFFPNVESVEDYVYVRTKYRMKWTETFGRDGGMIQDSFFMLPVGELEKIGRL